MIRNTVLVLVGCAGMTLGSTAWGQEIAEDFPVERFRLAMDREGLLDVEWGAVSAHKSWDLALWLGASDDPLVVYSEMGGDRERVGSLVTYRVAGTLVGAVGLFDRLELGLEVPLIVSQGQEDVAGIAMTDLSSFGLGDLRIAPKLRLVAANNLYVALLPSLTLPTGASADYRGEASVAFSPELIASRRLGAVRLSGNLGYRARSRTQLADLVVDDEIFLRVGGGYRFSEGGGMPLEIDLTVAGATGASSPLGDFNRNSLEVLAGASYDVNAMLTGVAAAGIGLNEGFGTPDWRVVVGLRYRRGAIPDPDGDGILGAADACPNEAEDVDTYLDSDGCPDDDNDNDGVLDVDDGAPLDPEDKDGFADADGIPDPDNDGDGILDGDDQCPIEAETDNGFQDEDGCPDALPDQDGDGIADNEDQCPTQAEDKDTYEDADGCPDPDNDGDGVLDTADRCPLVAGVRENRGCPDTDRDNDTVVDRLDNCPDEPGSPKNAGCKQKQLVQLTGSRLEILDLVYFDTNKDVIQKRSYGLLENVATVLKSHPEIKRIQVEGHTDDRGDDAANLDLSQRRANAVVLFLIQQGVPAATLIPKGFGETKPIKTNKTAAGRASNRRVEFNILDDTDAVIDSAGD